MCPSHAIVLKIFPSGMHQSSWNLTWYCKSEITWIQKNATMDGRVGFQKWCRGQSHLARKAAQRSKVLRNSVLFGFLDPILPRLSRYLMIVARVVGPTGCFSKFVQPISLWEFNYALALIFILNSMRKGHKHSFFFLRIVQEPENIQDPFTSQSAGSCTAFTYFRTKELPQLKL